MAIKMRRTVEPASGSGPASPPTDVEGDVAAAHSGDEARSQNGRMAHFLYVAASIGTRAGMFVLMIVLTRCLSVQDYGLFALAVTMGEILEVTATDWVRVHLLRALAAKVGISADVLGRSLLLVVTMAALAVVAAALVMPMVDREHALQLTIATTAYVIAFGTLRLALVLAQARQDHTLYVAVEGTRAVGIFVVSGLVVAWPVSDFLTVCLLLTGLAGAVGLVGLVVDLARLPRPRLTWIGYLPAIQFGIPLALSWILEYALGWLDRLIINFFAGPAQVALYAAAYAVARQPVELLITALNTFVFPMLVRANASGDPHQAARLQAGLLITYTIVGLGMAALLSLLATPVATLLFPPSYHASVATLIPLIAFGTYCLALRNFVFGSSIIATGRTWLNLASAVPPALSVLALGVPLISQYGEFGAGIAFALSAVIAVVTGAVLSLRVLRFEIPWWRLATIVAAIAIAGAATWLLLDALTITLSIVSLMIGTFAFALAYVLCLMLFGLSVRRLTVTPWAPFEDGQAAQTAPHPPLDAAR